MAGNDPQTVSEAANVLNAPAGWLQTVNIVSADQSSNYSSELLCIRFSVARPETAAMVNYQDPYPLEEEPIEDGDTPATEAATERRLRIVKRCNDTARNLISLLFGATAFGTAVFTFIVSSGDLTPVLRSDAVYFAVLVYVGGVTLAFIGWIKSYNETAELEVALYRHEIRSTKLPCRADLDHTSPWSLVMTTYLAYTFTFMSSVVFVVGVLATFAGDRVIFYTSIGSLFIIPVLILSMWEWIIKSATRLGMKINSWIELGRAFVRQRLPRRLRP